jgi:ERCC4-type nuclease
MPADDQPRSLLSLRGVGPARARALGQAGFHTLRDVQGATVDALASATGIGFRIAAEIKRDVERTLGGQVLDPSVDPDGARRAP